MVECGGLGSSSTSFAYPGARLPLFCPCAGLAMVMLWLSFYLFSGLSYGYLLAYPCLPLGLSWAPLGLVPVLVPYLFSGLVPGFSPAILCLLPGLALGCSVLHPLYLGLRPVTCPVPRSGASGSSTLVFGIYVYGFSLLSIGSLPWFRVYHLASQPLGCVLGCRLGLLCPCVKVALATP